MVSGQTLGRGIETVSKKEEEGGGEMRKDKRVPVPHMKDLFLQRQRRMSHSLPTRPSC